MINLNNNSRSRSRQDFRSLIRSKLLTSSAATALALIVCFLTPVTTQAQEKALP